jgi:hypothetical protein
MIQAIVKFAAGNPRDTKRGPRINAVVTLPDGSEQTIWDAPGGIVSSWKKGQAVTLEQNGQYYNPVKGDATQGTTQPQAQSAPALTRVDLDNEEAREHLYKRAAAFTDVYRSIYERLRTGDTDDPLDIAQPVNPEDLSSAAATIFIQLMRNA